MVPNCATHLNGIHKHDEQVQNDKISKQRLHNEKLASKNTLTIDLKESRF